MSYLMDHKTNLGSIAIPVGASNDIEIFSGFYVKPFGFPNPLFSIADNGTITIGDPLNPTPIVINSNIQYKFEQISGTGTNYLLSDSDYAIEILSNTYNFITLPSASGIGGRTYVLSRGTTSNNSLTLVTQPGQTIDGRASIALPQQNDHLMVMSNDALSWYIL